MSIFGVMPKITLKVESDNPQELSNGGDPLRALCQEEAESFDRFLRAWGEDQPEGSLERDYANGLAPWEKTVVAGYLYQKAMGRF